MDAIIHSATGFFHVVTAIASMAFGTMVLILRKGTKQHKFFGYGYLIMMVAMNLSSFFLTGLTGSFSAFHVAAIFSLTTLLAGIVPAFTRMPRKRWIMMHGTFMYFSVVGLYAAFFSEILTRIPGQSFTLMVLIASIGVTIIGALLYTRWRAKWFAESIPGTGV